MRIAPWVLLHIFSSAHRSILEMRRELGTTMAFKITSGSPDRGGTRRGYGWGGYDTRTLGDARGKAQVNSLRRIGYDAKKS